MDEPLPEEFDVVIIGTGLPESVLSGALSRINQKVLHLDSNDYYGSVWASFNINAFDDLMNLKEEINTNDDLDIQKVLNSGEALLPITRRSCIVDRESGCHLSKTIESETVSEIENESEVEENKTVNPEDAVCSEETTTDSKSNTENTILEGKDAFLHEDSNDALPPKDDADSAQNQDGQDSAPQSENKQSKSSEMTAELDSCQEPKPLAISPHENFYKQWRHFNIDLTSKVLYSRGLLVELLIQSNVSRYLEFRNVSQLLTLMDEKLHHVPCTRADVFKSKFVSVVQKRIMMRVLTTCANHEQHPEIERDFKEKKFVEFLDTNKLCKEAQHFIIHSIAMVNDDVSTMEGVCATKKFLQSLGRYGNCAFLYPLYGVGEIPQAFSRLSAVFGGLFCLRRCAIGLVVDQETGQCKGIVDSTDRASDNSSDGDRDMILPVYDVVALYLVFANTGAEEYRQEALKTGRHLEPRASDDRITAKARLFLLEGTLLFSARLNLTRATSDFDPRGQKIRCRYVIVDETNVPDFAQTQFKNYVSRAVYVTNKPVMSVSAHSTSKPTDHVSVISIPATEDSCSVRLVEAGPSASVCPRKHWLIHAVTKSLSSSMNVQSPKKAFESVERVLFSENKVDEDVSKDKQLPSSEAAGDAKLAENSKPRVLWHAYFNVLEQGVDSSKLPQNVFVLNGPGDELGFDAAMKEVRRVFEIICPEEEFLPRAPEPDEIVFNDEGYNTEKNGSSSSETPEEQEGDYGEREDELQEDAATADENIPAVQNNAEDVAPNAPTNENNQT